jgi:D-glycero-D-manno-heptose 1,7-bisphosphate phosphatase
MFALHKAAFIDRDGVINEERNYVHRIEDFVLLPGVVEALTLLRDAGYLLIVVTNQAGIARGYYDVPAINKLHEYLRIQLAENGVTLDGIYFCPHHPDGLVNGLSVEYECRKPAPGMLLQAAQEFNIDLASSVMIGDKTSDIQAGKRAGVGFTILVESGHKIDLNARNEADLVQADLRHAAISLAPPNFSFVTA